LRARLVVLVQHVLGHGKQPAEALGWRFPLSGELDGRIEPTRLRHPFDVLPGRWIGIVPDDIVERYLDIPGGQLLFREGDVPPEVAVVRERFRQRKNLSREAFGGGRRAAIDRVGASAGRRPEAQQQGCHPAQPSAHATCLRHLR
jgi:hypothetical protein